MRILIAEDEKALNRILVKQFTKLGYSVDSCFDGESVFDFIKLADYDAIVMDVMMPKKDGFTVLEEMRQMKNRTPVIFLTAKTEISDRVYGLDLGANDYLVKPFSFEELAARVRMITRDSKDNTTLQLMSKAVRLKEQVRKSTFPQESILFSRLLSETQVQLCPAKR